MSSVAQLKVLREVLSYLPGEVCAWSHKELPAACVARGLPEPELGPEHKKIDRATASFDAVANVDLPGVARTVLALGVMDAARRNLVQDALWALEGHPPVPERARRDIARSLGGVELFREFGRLERLLDGLWVLDSDPFGELFGTGRSLRRELEQHMGRNDDWDAGELFTRVGAYEASDRRFGLFLEGLASSANVPDEEVQRGFVAAVQPHLRGIGLELRETSESGGYPVFTLVVARSTRGRPKNLLFASLGKPDLRIVDALDNDIEIVGDTDGLIDYDLPVGSDGLRWRDLQDWWRETRGHDTDEEAKRTLYTRLLASLPEDSPIYPGHHPQRLLFHLYNAIYEKCIPGLPALLPEIWLHWDPRTVRARGAQAFRHHRMDFLLLLPNSVRVVVEVDGQHHYATGGYPDPAAYAANMKADRDLKLKGYEVFRFGADELRDEHRARGLVEAFFRDLFTCYRVPVPTPTPSTL
ncbi:hypothetical protein [Actinokineospora diospyrosa]|uniref:AbiJ-NTD3 domain-containing protein n=1 Tax=Actinokineospora diospyrosa TaxID=103728 RepID=A0ABT1I5Y2_9PSEU|nr:hypothetical protein [Actinokineospora diospyrosa]MCP2267981.1 hypothetical protein [Actinokineospora diospyrosa]